MSEGNPLFDPNPMGGHLQGLQRGKAVGPPLTSNKLTPAGEVHKVVHIKDLLKCDSGGKVDLDPTEERNTEIKDDLRVVTDKDLLEKVTISGCSKGCTKIIAVNVGRARNVELKSGAIPVLRNLIAITNKGCTVTWKGFELNITNAVNHLNSNAQPKSISYCARYVQNAIRAGGINVPGANATDFGPVLQNNGFSPVATNNTAGFTPQTGDVVVLPATGTHEFGHTAMWNGTQWVSDFKQRNLSIWRDVPNPRYTVYRHYSAGNQAHAGPL